MINSPPFIVRPDRGIGPLVDASTNAGWGRKRGALSGHRSRFFACVGAIGRYNVCSVRSWNGPHKSWIARLSVDRIFAAIVRPRTVERNGPFGERTLQVVHSRGFRSNGHLRRYRVRELSNGNGPFGERTLRLTWAFGGRMIAHASTGRRYPV